MWDANRDPTSERTEDDRISSRTTTTPQHPPAEPAEASETLTRFDARPHLQALNLVWSAVESARPSTASSRARQLTAQELAVSHLVVEGLSNKEIAAQLIVSVKTVEYHLGHAFAKLGVRSRTQLAKVISSAP